MTPEPALSLPERITEIIRDAGNSMLGLTTEDIARRLGVARAQRDNRWNFRVESQSDTLVREAATLLGTSKTAFVEESAVRRAETVIAEHRRIKLDAEGFSRFVDSLEAAPTAVPELVDLFARPSPIPPS